MGNNNSKSSTLNTQRKPRKRPYKGNPTLLALLQMGAEVSFPDQTTLHGMVETGDIAVYFNHSHMGSYALSREGLDRALGDNDVKRAIKDNQS